jgi:hypothetical protein
LKRKSLSPLRWGLTACDGPFDGYFAEAAPPLAIGKVGAGTGIDGKPRVHPLERGTLTVYGVGSSLQHHPEQTIAALWECMRLKLLHPRFGFADAFNLDIHDAWHKDWPAKHQAVLRNHGPWQHSCGFAIDKGPALIVLDGFLRDGAVQELFMSHPGIRQQLKSLFPNAKLD